MNFKDEMDEKIKNAEKAREQGRKSEPTDEFQDILDINKKILTVHSNRVNELLTDDAVMAYFPEKKDKVFIIEMVHASYLSMNALSEMYEKTKLMYKYNLKREMPEEITKGIEKAMKNTSDMFLVQIHTFLDLNRNVPNNPIVMASLNNMENANGDSERDEMSDTMKGIKKALENQEKKKEEN